MVFPGDIEHNEEHSPINSITINYISAGRRPPVVNLSSLSFINRSALFFIDSGSEISLVKEDILDKNNLSIDKSLVLIIKGVTPGECLTLGSTIIVLNGLQCKVHVVPSNFAIETNGLLGWELLNQFKGKLNAETQSLELSDLIIPFVCNEKFIIPPRTKQVIYATVKNPDIKVGHVALQNLGKEILFGNFIGTNRNGKIYAYILNISDSVVQIDPPRVSLEPCETTNISGDIFDEEKFEKLDYNEEANIFKLIVNDEIDKDRAAKVFAELDPNTLKHLNEEEINHIKQLIKENPRIFSLPGEKLQATHLITHEIKLTSDIPVRAKGFRQPPIIKE